MISPGSDGGGNITSLRIEALRKKGEAHAACRLGAGVGRSPTSLLSSPSKPPICFPSAERETVLAVAREEAPKVPRMELRVAGDSHQEVAGCGSSSAFPVSTLSQSLELYSGP